ncbi:helix-turn-helix domain-containing protein [Solirubrobacter taibaiensis]|nr:helix-turn-helix domain-containing protein [Solirubrobacter taibaiensis]
MGKTERMEERDDRIVERYREGETMQAIADDVGVSRARIQQILAARGEVVAAALEVRKQRRADKRFSETEEFWAHHGVTIEALANQGQSKQLILDRFALLFPELDQAVIQAALDRSGITFSKLRDPQHFPDAALELGVWYVLGLHLEVDSDRGAALASMDFDEARLLRDALEQRGFSREQIAEILAVAIDAREFAATSACSLSKAKHDQLRRPTVVAQGDGQGLHPWPADSQTVMKRLGNGYWTEAMVRIGLVANEGGRSRGLLLFSEDSYPRALEKYVNDRGVVGATTSYDDYDAWRRREYRDGRTWPSAMAIRNRFGSWSSAMRSTAGAVTGAPSTAAPLTRDAGLGAKMLPVVAEEMQRRLQAIRGIERPAERDAEVREFLKSYAGNFEIDRRAWLREMILLDPRAVARRLAPSAPKLDKKLRDALSAAPPDLGAALTDRYLDRTLSTGGIANSDGWLSPAVQAQLDALSPLSFALYEVLRAARNLVTHDSEESRVRMREALEAAAALDAEFRYQRPITERNILGWLSSGDQGRLRRIAEVMPDIWRAMTVAEAVHRAEV